MTRTPGCATCGERRAWWATTEAGKRLLVDPDPTDDGTLVRLTDEERTRLLPAVALADGPVVRVLPAATVRALQEDQDVLPGLLMDSDVHSPYRDRPRYRAHFATCPQANKHRRT